MLCSECGIPKDDAVQDHGRTGQRMHKAEAIFWQGFWYTVKDVDN